MLNNLTLLVAIKLGFLGAIATATYSILIATFEHLLRKYVMYRAYKQAAKAYEGQDVTFLRGRSRKDH